MELEDIGELMGQNNTVFSFSLLFEGEIGFLDGGESGMEELKELICF